jgi:hypothetical protein
MNLERVNLHSILLSKAWHIDGVHLDFRCQTISFYFRIAFAGVRDLLSTTPFFLFLDVTTDDFTHIYELMSWPGYHGTGRRWQDGYGDRSDATMCLSSSEEKR